MTYIPGSTQEDFKHKNLIVDGPTRHIAVNIPAGQGEVVEGQLMGKQDRQAGTPAAAGGNTGNGTLSNFALLAKAQKGTYKLTMLTATTFYVSTPDGERLKDGAIGTTYDSQIAFDLAAGGTAFVAGDSFDLPVDDGPGTHVKLDSTALDGSQHLAGVLNSDADASTVAKRGDMLVEGVLNSM